ncbi:MAG: glycosyltransferase family 2 protein [Bacteroidia bacterium]|nr:glycosyltransferase family 2 protein [Bacteroidia bacterium]
MDISIVIPLYNEEESLAILMADIQELMDTLPQSYEVVMVDDGSRDKSWEVVQQLAKTYPLIRGIRFQRNYGKAAALQIGFEAARGDVVITMDADGQDRPTEIPELYRMITEDGFDLVSGWKKKRHDPPSKTIPSKLFNSVVRMVSGIRLHDFNCGLKAYKNQVVKSIEVYGAMHRYIPLLAKWAGFDRIGEKVVEHREREHGVSKFGGRRLITGGLDLLSLLVVQRYFKKPMHFFGSWGALFTLIGAADLIYLLTIKIVEGQLGNRLPAIAFGMVMFLAGIMLFSTGWLAELIARNSPFKNTYKISERVIEGERVMEELL